jgi:hypothetical protein
MQRAPNPAPPRAARHAEGFATRLFEASHYGTLPILNL